jgi:hypothetical protein
MTKIIYKKGGGYKTNYTLILVRCDTVSISYKHRFSTFRLTKINKRKYEDIYK